MARDDKTPAQIRQDGINELAALVGPLQAPQNVGNVQDDPAEDARLAAEKAADEPAPVDASAQAPVDASAEPQAGDATPEAPGAGETDGLQTDDDTDGETDRIAALEAKWEEKFAGQQASLEQRERELEFMRAGIGIGQGATAIPDTPADPANVDLGFQITAADAAVLAAGDENAAAYWTRVLNLVARATAQHTINTVVRADSQRNDIQAQSTTQVNSFYNAHPELRPFADIVKMHAEELWPQMPHATDEKRLDMLAGIVKQRLSKAGVKLQAPEQPQTPAAGAAPAAPAAAARGIRPAMGESGSGRGSNTSGRLTAKQKEMLELSAFDPNYQR